MARRRRWRSRLIVGGVLLVLAAAGVTVARAQAGSTPGYRTATVSRASVTAALDLVGTIVPKTSATVGFAQSGTVASVDVAPGTKVTAGQTVAQLDLTSLQSKLTQAQAVEAAARLTLVEAENGQLPASGGGGSSSSGGSSSVGSSSVGSSSVGSSSGGSSSGGASTRASSGSGGSGSTSSGGASAAVASAQQKVLSAQRDVDAAQGVAQRAMTAASATCRSGGGSPTAAQRCLAAESSLLQAQAALAAKETALSAAQSSMTKALTSASAASAGSAGAGGSAGSSSSSASAAPASATVSAAQLAAFQATLDADTAAVGVAQQNLDQGTAVSPLSGTVVAVGLAQGQTVAAASSTAVITVSATDGYQVTTTVPVASVGQVSVGEQAAMVPDGGTATLTGTVVAIGSTPTSSGYPVTLGLPASATGLRQGGAVSVQLTTGTVQNAVVVPTSAVRSFGTRHLVEVLSGGAVQPAVVTVGVMDPLRTQILTGLTPGQQVVLADLSSTVTSDSTTTGSGGGLGGLAGRGLGGSGLRGGGLRTRAGG